MRVVGAQKHLSTYSILSAALHTAGHTAAQAWLREGFLGHRQPSCSSCLLSLRFSFTRVDTGITELAAQAHLAAGSTGRP